MRFHRAIAFIPSAAVLALIATPALAASRTHAHATRTHPSESAQAFAQQVVHNEIRKQKGKPVYWRYLEINQGSGVKKVYDVYQTQAGTVKKLLGVNGKPLSPAQRKQQNARLENILNHPSKARQAQKARNHDGDQERQMLAMLPSAFIFRYDGRVGHLVRLQFHPNPQFHPPTREGKVFHDMVGHILVEPKQMRLAEMQGRLTKEVKFWWGLLGYLDAGGTFLVRQADIQGHNWMMTRLKVDMNGKALFFKTIGVQENQRFEDFRENPSGMTLRQAVEQLKQATLPRRLAAGG